MASCRFKKREYEEEVCRKVKVEVQLKKKRRERRREKEESEGNNGLFIRRFCVLRLIKISYLATEREGGETGKERG